MGMGRMWFEERTWSKEKKSRIVVTCNLSLIPSPYWFWGIVNLMSRSHEEDHIHLHPSSYH
jgi:hypothetical protein